jgi:hypothetical protein
MINDVLFWDVTGKETTMEPLLWTFEDIKRFANHPDAPLRLWVVERLIKHFPDRAGEVLVTILDDPGNFIAGRALDFLAETGETEKYGPILLEHLQRAEGDHLGRLAWTLARLGYRPALPVILPLAQQVERKAGLIKSPFTYLVEALGEFGGPEVRQTLWALLEQESPSGSTVTTLMGALLQAAQPEDIPRLIQHYRTLPRSDRLWQSPLLAFADSVGASPLVEEMASEIDAGLWAMLEIAAWWLNAPLSLSGACLDDLEDAFDHLYTDVPEILLPEAQRLFAERGDDIAGWQAAWESGERPSGYRRRALYTWLIFQALAEQPMATLTPRHQESVMGLGLLAQLSVESDDQARLEAATDKTETLLAILAEPREHVLPDIIERVVALGPEVAPRLIDLLDPEDFGWGTIRMALAIGRMARAYLGSCDAAVPKLIDLIHNEQGDYLNEAASEALEAIGPAAVELINSHLRRTRDMSRQIYLTGVLGEIPVESAAQFILTKLKAGKPIEEQEVNVLSDIGSASAIEPLYQLWEPGDRYLAGHLLILCELNGVQKPELPEWRRLMMAEEERTAKLMAGDFDLLEEPEDQPEPQFPLLRTWQLEQEAPQATSGRKKTTGKKKKKKQTPKRKKGKGKKKKRRS